MANAHTREDHRLDCPGVCDIEIERSDYGNFAAHSFTPPTVSHTNPPTCARSKRVACMSEIQARDDQSKATTPQNPRDVHAGHKGHRERETKHLRPSHERARALYPASYPGPPQHHPPLPSHEGKDESGRKTL